MHTVYVDVLVFLNVFEDFLLLLCVKYILRLSVRRFRLVLGSAAGGMMSLCALIPQDIFVINIAIKILTSALLSLIAFGFKSRKSYLRTTSTLIVVTFLFSGAMICFYLTIRPAGMEIVNDTVYFNISPVLLIILTLIIYFILFAYRKLFGNHATGSLVRKINILYKNNNYICECKTDSGCNLKEPFSGSSVIVVEKSVFGSEKPAPLRVIPFDSLGGNGIIYGFRPESVEIDGKKVEEEIYIGMCEGIFKGDIKGVVPDIFQEDYYAS